MANDQQKSQKGQGAPIFTEDQARAYFESRRWPNGPACVHCGSTGVFRLQGKATRPGLLKCRDCKGQFTVTVGTVMEDSHLPLAKWAMAFHLMVSSKKGISALQLQRNLGLGSYKTAWHLAHRIREAMKAEPLAGKLKGEVQVDETFVGGKPRKGNGQPNAPRGRATNKTPVVALVETDGRVVSRPIVSVDSATLAFVMHKHIDMGAKVVTDDFRAYRPPGRMFRGGHTRVNHSGGEYCTPDGSNTNTVESYFALLKRGVHGTFHHVSPQHLSRYCHEFAFRWNGRKLSDTQRRDEAVKGAEGKRLMYRQPIDHA